ncbi:MAG: response regulator [Candidatus Eremiobacterota bacterium]
MSKLLIVDDNEQNLYMLDVLLSGNGYLVEQVLNGAEALERARLIRPDMIISDILMPVMDGFALCRACKADEVLKNIPFVFYTATYTDRKDEEFALSLGADRFIIKPAEPDVFLAVIRETINNCESRKAPVSASSLEETEYYRDYSEALIRKLEDKMVQLEEANRNLELDITERMRVEDALKKSQSLLAETEKVGHVGGWEFNIDTGKQIWTEEIYHIHEVDLTYEPTVSKGINFYTPSTRPVIEEAVKRIVDYGEPFDLELEIITARGNLRSVHVIGKPDMERRRVYGFFQDITEGKVAEEEKRKLQEQLIQSQKMESIGRLAGGIAHDFNNMLGVIMGYAELARSYVDSTHKVYDNINEILKAVRRSTELTRQLLAFARRQTVTPRVLNLNDTMAGMLKMIQRLIGDELELIWKPGEGLWPVMIDPGQVDQILVNLCVNARDAITGPGQIIIETDNVLFSEGSYYKPDGLNAGEYVRLSVRDSGCGMDSKTMKHIFEPFFTTKDTGKGTGLGLSTVYGIVKQNYGYISVVSKINHGTTFDIYLPRNISPDEPATNPVATSISVIQGYGTVLLVEDEPLLMELIKKMLETLGYKVLAALTPGEAIGLAGEYTGEIHILITDLVMPEMNGRELLRQIQKIYPAVKSLFMSGYTSDVEGNRYFLDDGMHFLQKPYSMETLADKLHELMLNKIVFDKGL